MYVRSYIATHVIYKVFMSIIVIEPDDVTVCEGGGVVYSCVLNTANTNISSDDVQWYRFIKNTGTTEMINQNGTSITFATNHSGNVLTTNLTITNAVTSYAGYYWVKLPSNFSCNTSVTVGTSTYVNRVLPYPKYITHSYSTKLMLTIVCILYILSFLLMYYVRQFNY